MTGVQFLMGPLSGRNIMSGKRPRIWMMEGRKACFPTVDKMPLTQHQEQGYPCIDALEEEWTNSQGSRAEGRQEDVPDEAKDP